MTSQIINPTAVIDPSARIGENVEIGPFCVIGPEAEIGDGTRLLSHVVVEARTIIGPDCVISPGAVLGGAPQDLSYKGEPTRVRIGRSCQIRECVTINRASGEGNETVLGDDAFLMAYSHMAHNCQVGNNVILANAVQLGGHVTVSDYAFIGGSSVVHQHCRIGRMAIMGGASATRQDIPPFAMSEGRAAGVTGINTIGLRRRGLNGAERQNLKKAFFYLWFSGMTQTHAIEAIRENLMIDSYIEELISFIQSSKRGIGYKREASSPESTESEGEPAAEPLTI